MNFHVRVIYKYIMSGGSAVSGIDGMTLTDMGWRGSFHHVTR